MSCARRIGQVCVAAACIAGRAVPAFAEQAEESAPAPAPEPAPPVPAPEVSAAPAAPAPPELPAVPPPPAPAETVSSLEISGTMGPSVVFGEPANPAYTQSSFRRVGVFGEAAVAYRSSYFLDPFISVGYAALASGKSELPSGPWGAGGTLDQHLNAWVISPGITIDIWRIRLRYGLGLALVMQSFSYLGQDHSSTQKPLVHQGGLGFTVLDNEGFRLDAETRLVTAAGADVTFMTFDVVARGDLIRFAARKR